MKRTMSLVVAVTLLISLLIVPAFAADCSHDYDECDVCSKCGALRVHEFDASITFYTIKDNVPIWSEPTKNSEKVRTVKNQDTSLEIDGLLRNQYGNIWLRVEDQNSYVYIENVYIDFGTLAIVNYEYVSTMPTTEMQLAEFYDLVRPGGTADYKNWLDPSSRGIPYHIRIDGKMYSMTAERLGNIHYGFLGSAVGFTADTLHYAGGFVNELGLAKATFSNIRQDINICSVFMNSTLRTICVGTITSAKVGKLVDETVNYCSRSYCDTSEDTDDVQLGIDYFNNGYFSD